MSTAPITGPVTGPVTGPSYDVSLLMNSVAVSVIESKDPTVVLRQLVDSGFSKLRVQRELLTTLQKLNGSKPSPVTGPTNPVSAPS